MASACVNKIGLVPENFLECPAMFPSYGWMSPGVSFSRETPVEESKIAGPKSLSDAEKLEDQLQSLDLDVSWKDLGDFEFRLDDSVTMLPADELFANGKLMPLQFSTVQPPVTSISLSSGNRSPESVKCSRNDTISSSEQYLFSPKAPRCASKWKDLLGLKRMYQNSSKQDSSKTTASSPLKTSSNPKSLKHFLRNSTKSSSSASAASLSLPLLKELDCESVSISSRLSLSSSSSGHEHEDIPRLSLDFEKPNQLKNTNLYTRANNNPPRMKAVKTKAGPLIDHPAAAKVGRSPMRRVPAESSVVTVESPRMNPAGKIVFQNLERSSSSPCTFNGAPRHKHSGMERSYSAHVRVTPFLNVPVCSLRGSSKSGSIFGFGQLGSAPPKKDNGSSSSNCGSNRGQHSSYSKIRTDRI